MKYTKYTGEEKNIDEIKGLLDKSLGEFIVLANKQEVRIRFDMCGYQDDDCHGMGAHDPNIHIQETYYCGILAGPIIFIQNTTHPKHFECSKPKINVGGKHITILGGKDMLYSPNPLNLVKGDIVLNVGDCLSIGNNQVIKWILNNHRIQLVRFLKGVELLEKESLPSQAYDLRQQTKNLLRSVPELVYALQQDIAETVMSLNAIEKDQGRQTQNERIKAYQNRMSLFESFLEV